MFGCLCSGLNCGLGQDILSGVTATVPQGLAYMFAIQTPDAALQLSSNSKIPLMRMVTSSGFEFVAKVEDALQGIDLPTGCNFMATTLSLSLLRHTDIHGDVSINITNIRSTVQCSNTDFVRLADCVVGFQMTNNGPAVPATFSVNGTPLRPLTTAAGTIPALSMIVIVLDDVVIVERELSSRPGVMTLLGAIAGTYGGLMRLGWIVYLCCRCSRRRVAPQAEDAAGNTNTSKYATGGQPAEMSVDYIAAASATNAMDNV